VTTSADKDERVTSDVPDLFRRHYLALVRLAMRLVDDQDTAEDLVQDVFLGLSRRQVAMDDEYAYLRGAVLNRSRSALRRRRVASARWSSCGTTRTFPCRRSPACSKPPRVRSPRRSTGHFPRLPSMYRPQEIPMTSELPNAIRQALHADELAAADLRQPALRDAPPRRPGTRILAATGSAAAIATVAVVLAVVLPAHSGDRQSAGSAGALGGVVGHRWRVTGLHDAHGTLAVPTSLRAEVGFTRDGYVLGDDTVNALQGRYRETTDGYTLRDGGTTLAAYAGKDPDRLRVIAAVDALFLVIVDSVGSRQPAPTVRVAARFDGQRLTLERGGTVLSFTRSGPQADFASQTASPTPTSGGDVGSVSGRLLAVGGPSDTPARPLPGTVTLTDTLSKQRHSVTFGGEGTFTLSVPAGAYEVVGHSPQYGDGGYTCRAKHPVRVSAGQSVQVDVICEEK
jgi:DNA-directed RNA polymerase specialized sigma24 family protein